jgi:hypothetical protein
MDKSTLVDEDIRAGRRLIEALDAVKFPLVAALWYYLPDGGPWRLLLSSPVVDEAGPRAAYRKIQEVLGSTGPYPFFLDSISAVSPEEPPITDLRIFAGTDGPPFIGGNRLLKARLGDAYIEEAYIYRAERIIGTSGVISLLCAVPDRGRKVWRALKGKMAVEGGLIQSVEVEGETRPQTRTKTGVNAVLRALVHVKKEGGQVFGDVQKWVIHGGRLESVETVVAGVPIEGIEGPVAVASPGSPSEDQGVP